ncbi:MAG: hypothetical protein WD852_02010 [Methyloceanibacter sp.]
MLLALFDTLPEIVVDDSQLRHRLDHPFVFRVGSRLTPPGIWVLHELLAVPDEPADIELIIENARAALPIAVNCGRSPAPGDGTRNALLVQRLRDRSRRAAVCEFGEDAADDCSFCVVDAALAAYGLAVGIDLPHHVITEAETASGFPFANAAFEAAPGLLSKVFEE